MKADRMITVVGAHAEGEIGKVITGGVLPPPGDTLLEQQQWLQNENDGFRKFLSRKLHQRQVPADLAVVESRHLANGQLKARLIS